jgi:hypothetical protein
MDANSRVQIVEVPVAEPGICFMCRIGGGVDSRVFIDFGVQFDWYGQVLFCEYCLASVAEATGFVNSIEFDTMKKLVEGFSSKIDELARQNKVLKNAMVDLCNSSSYDDDLLVRTMDRALKSAAYEGTSSGNDEGESKADESSSKQGPKRVRNATGTK